jgi:nitroimidazol reductase NimA-like FMN-containing flavoprotein (pyridoxamine 5'-phosphate oxidase superfamily)
MHETAQDLEMLQALLDRSYANGGTHLQRVITPERRLTAVDLVPRLEGMCLLTVATVTADGRPIGGPNDGVFYRGAFHFGSAPDAVRIRHLRQRPHVTATHLPGEELSVTVHGRAVFVDVKDPEHRGYRQTLLDIYTPRYGEEWEQFLDSGPAHFRIDADRMFTFHMDADE